ncbi:TniQ family protein [Paraburkholderia sp. BL10I2N1]|uniref:TniQ family protein n=1 Tax=Paraburkholderia sp. BL10I2N1 TaxID=1938796 RepID=UPI00105FE902|nr:TniQ family protein [Paraburkholderia sp. BL10I2N1]TDN64019.1 TniQ protein [Paraburkholderia sp. BL10I2N1]
MAIALFPLLNGETIGSNLGRYGNFIGLETTLPLRQRLFGYACMPDTRLPSGLDHLVAETRDYWDLDAEAIIRDYTEFHYATLTVSEKQREAMRSDMLGRPAGRCSRRSACGWSGEIVSRFRYCEDCLLDWKAKRIPAHWMVDHQIPGVYVCCTHSRMLKVTVSDFSKNLTDTTVVELRGRADEEVLTRLSVSERSAIEDVAKRSVQYRMPNDGLPSATTYRELLREAGFVWPDGRMDHRAFIACFLKHFGHEYCRLAGLDWQKMTVWLRNIADQSRDKDASHPLMFIAAESLLNRRCSLPGSFVPATWNTMIARGTDWLDCRDNSVNKKMRELSCVGILHRRNDTWRECLSERAGWKLVCSCGVSYRVPGLSSSEKAPLTVEAYGARYRDLILMGLADDGSAPTASRAVRERFLRWARYAGFRKNTDLSRDEVQRMRDRWCSLVQNAPRSKKITSAYRVDPALYRTLCRHDHEWFAAFNFANRTRLAFVVHRRGTEPVSH